MAGPAGRRQRAGPRPGRPDGSVSVDAAPARAGAVLIQSHVAASWGDNSTGQLGDGLTTGALRSDGIVFAWGLNGSGQLGNGTTTESSKPVKIAGLSQVTGIAAGWDSAVAIESSSISALTSVWTWGANDQGQLGDGTLADHSTPERVTGIPASVRGVSAGVKYAVVLGADGSVWGWGENVTGELGVAREGSAVTRPVNAIAAGSGITQLSAGGGHVLALKSDGTVLAWGFNRFGQLGNGTTAEVGGLGPVTSLTGATYVAAGFSSSLAVHTVLGS